MNRRAIMELQEEDRGKLPVFSNQIGGREPEVQIIGEDNIPQMPRAMEPNSLRGMARTRSSSWRSSV